MTAFPEVDDADYQRGPLLGDGGFGSTYLATDAGGAQVVIKELHADREQFRNRFALEAHSLAKLRHPNIVQALRLGRWRSSRRLFFVMTHVVGRSYSRIIDELRGLARVRADYQIVGRVLDAIVPLRDCADALAHAHQQGIIHRDVKPDNIIVADDRSVALNWGLIATLIDWGLVASIGDRPTVAGSPFYFSPEQAAGETASGAMDVYALGACLYELLSGQPPYRAELDRPIAFKEACAIVVSERPMAISHSEPVLARLAALAMRCLGPPSDRPSMVDLFNELDVHARRCMCTAHKQIADRMGAKRIATGWLCNGCRLEHTIDGKAFHAVPPSAASESAPVFTPRSSDDDIVRQAILAERSGVRSTLGRDALASVVIEELLPEAPEETRVTFAHVGAALGLRPRCFPALLRGGADRFVREQVTGEPLSAQGELDDARYAQLLAGVARYCRAVLDLHDRGFSCGATAEHLVVVWREQRCDLVANEIWQVEQLAITFSPWADPDPAWTADLQELAAMIGRLLDHVALQRPRFALLRQRLERDIANDHGVHSMLQGIDLEIREIVCHACGCRVPSLRAVLAGMGYFCGECAAKQTELTINFTPREIAANRVRERITNQQAVLIIVILLLPLAVRALVAALIQLGAG